MQNLINRLGKSIHGVINGFDRIVFKGMLRPVMFAEGAMNFLYHRGVLNKNFKKWAMEQTGSLVSGVEAISKEETGHGITIIPSSNIRKEDLARKRQAELKIDSGVIGAWSCVEAGQTFKSSFSNKGYPELRWTNTRCKHLYLYMDHPQYGFLNLRIQTWFPYQIQICMNGREWLRRQLDLNGSEYSRVGNKFLELADFKVAQQCLADQLNTNWASMLNGLTPSIFPNQSQILGDDLHYYWTVWQSEWASDFICKDIETAQHMSDQLLTHALVTGTGDRVLRYFCRPIKANGQPHANYSGEVQSRLLIFHDGMRVKHWVDHNSVKAYNELNNFRVETTINNPGRFKAMRDKENRKQKSSSQPPDQKKAHLPLRKGVADTTLRAEASQGINNRFCEQMATFEEKTPLSKLIEPIAKPMIKKKHRVRALAPMTKDRELLESIADQRHSLVGFSNADLREILREKDWGKGRSEKQLSARVSRHIKLLRDHGLIRKMPHQKRYQLTQKGRNLTISILVVLASSIQELMKEAA